MLLKRDRDFLIGKAIENFGMGIGMALIFLQLAAFPSGTNGSDQVAKFFLAGCPGNYNKEVSDSYQKFLAGTYGSIFLTSFHILLDTLTGTPTGWTGGSSTTSTPTPGSTRPGPSCSA